MIKLQDTGLIEGLPPGIAEQHWVKVLDAVFRERQKKELEAVRKVFVYTAIDSAPENILDILAVQFKVDWYRMITPSKPSAGLSRRPWRCGGTAAPSGQ